MARPKKARPVSVKIYEGSDGLWHGYLTVGSKPNGRPDRRHRTGRTREECEQKIRDLEDEAAAGRVTAVGGAPTVEEWFTTWLTTIANRPPKPLKPRTLDDYWSKCRHWVFPHLGAHRLDKLDSDHLDALYAAMARAGRSGSVTKVHAIVRRGLEVARRRRKITANVAHDIDSHSSGKLHIEPFEQEEARRILDAAEAGRNPARWSIGFGLGLRQGEALGLRWPDIDLEQLAIHVGWQLQRLTWDHGCDDPARCARWKHGCRQPAECAPTADRCPKRVVRCRVEACPTTYEHGCADGERCRAKSGRGCRRRRAVKCRRHRQACPPLCAKECTKHAAFCPQRRPRNLLGDGEVQMLRGGLVLARPKDGTRTVPLPPELAPILRAHRKAQLRERVAAGSVWSDHDLVFADVDGTPIDPRVDYETWVGLLKAAGVRHGRLHDARHTAGTLLVELGVDIRVVMEILGHSDLRMTQQYTKATSKLAQDAAARIGGALFGPSATDQATGRWRRNG